MKHELEGKIFRSLENTENGEVGADTVFHYRQDGDVVWATYEGGDVVKGHLLANVLPDGRLDMRYHHINRQGRLMLGKCISTPSLDANGKLRLSEEWQWLSGDMSCGRSELIEQ